MKTGSITYNGKNSLELGVYTTGSGSFDAAELDVDKYEIPGRNGDLILSNNRYKNIEITYPAFIPKAFMDKVQNVRNWLRSSRVYARLEDTYDTDHFRMGLASGVQSFEPANRNDGANFEMTFDCKPQRFLKAGETPETVEPDVQTESGEIASFETDYVVPMTSAEISLSPQQDLNGYNKPWAGGANLNKLPNNATDGSTTHNGVTVKAENGVYTFSGTASGNAQISFPLSASVDLSPSTNKICFLNTKTMQNIYCYFRRGTTNVHYWQMAPENRVTSGWTDSGNEVVDYIYLWVASGTNTDGMTISPMLVELTETTPTTFSPWQNICPISGHTGATLVRSSENMLFPSDFVQGSINNSGAAFSSNTRIRSAYIAVEPNTQYAFEIGDDLSFYEIHEYVSANGVNTKYTTINSATGTITTVSTTNYIRVLVRYSNNAAVDPSRVKAVQMRKGSTTNLDEYSVTFTDQGTVYGGTFDFVSGKLRVTQANIASYAGEALPGAWISDRDVYAAGTTPTTGAQVVYELATPQTFSLSAQQIETLLGENNVWSDAGPITLTYAEPFTIENPTLFDARPLFTVTNPAEGDVITVNGQTITFVDGYSGTVIIDCETMNAYSGAANLNSIIEAADFPVLVPGTNIVTWTGTGVCTMTPRWWEL